MKKYVFISVLTAIIFLGNCSKDMYRNTANTPALFTQQLTSSFKHNHIRQLEALSINRAELIETLTNGNKTTAQKYSLLLIQLANNQQAFFKSHDLLLKQFSRIKKRRAIIWKNIKLLKATYIFNDNKLEMNGLLIIQDAKKQTDTILFSAIKLQNKWYLLKLK